MGVLLSIFGIEENISYTIPEKKIVGTIYGIEISLAHLVNFLLFQIASALIILLEYGPIPAVTQGFFCGDPLISHKYQGDTITPVTLGVTCVLLPILIVTLTEILAHESLKKINLYPILFYLHECLLGTVMVLLITSIAKVIVGEHRPHFFDTCKPDTAINCTIGEFIEKYTCTSKEFSAPEIVDASLSFPSGHSSISWFIGIYLSYVVHVRTTTVNVGYVMKPFLISVILTWSMLCSLSRITDRRHHWWDVLTGSIFGILAALYWALVVSEKVKKNYVLDRYKSASEDIQLSRTRGVY